MTDWMNKIEFGDCRDIMRRWAEQGVKAQMCVTSPPYYGLRSYLPNEHPDKALEIGLEGTPDEYVANMVEVFRCVRDVLADDGTLWLNIGDSYASQGGKEPPQSKWKKEGIHDGQNGGKSRRAPSGLKPKDLIGIPWMLAFALRADGWFLRQEIIWAKGVSGDAARAGWSGNPMPESVTDRCTKAHEHIFLLSKSERYYFDSEAIKEPAVSEKPAGNKRHKYADAYAAGNSEEHRTKAGLLALTGVEWEKRNRRSVWTVAPRPYKGAHFAVFPPALIEPCILAGSRPGDIVLDPFMGSGTTAAVAMQHGRQYLGCELNTAYKPLQDERLQQLSLSLEV